MGGAVTGAAIGAMHYIGMAAVRAPANAIWDWQLCRVVTADCGNCGAMAFGMRIVVRGASWRSQAAETP